MKGYLGVCAFLVFASAQPFALADDEVKKDLASKDS